MASTSEHFSETVDQSESSQAFCLRWNHFQMNMLNVFEKLFLDERFVDVTLACEGHLVKAHKMVLSASSSYFQEIFTTIPCPHPVIIMKDVQLNDLRKILEFMYKGEINVQKNEIASLLVVAEALQVRGLGNKDAIDDKTEPQPSTSNANVSQNQRATTKLNRLLKRTNTRHSSTESLVLIEESQPLKQITSNEQQDFLLEETGNSFVMDDYEIDEHAEDYEDSNFDPITIENIQHIKSENEQHFDTDYTIANSNMPSIFHWMDPNAQINTPQIETDSHKSRTTRKNEMPSPKLKVPSWTANQLREAIESVVTQKMRFTQASMKYNIPKGTLYNILGKSNRMEVLAKAGLNSNDENAVLDFCCDLSSSPYNRRTRKPLSEILQFVYRLVNCNHKMFDESGRFAYRWWWAFCKKYSIVSLHYDNNANIKINEKK